MIDRVKILIDVATDALLWCDVSLKIRERHISAIFL